MEKVRITVQALNRVDGSSHEVTVRVPVETEQQAADYLFARAKVEMAYKFLGEHGYITPVGQTAVDFGKYGNGWYVNEG